MVVLPVFVWIIGVWLVFIRLFFVGVFFSGKFYILCGCNRIALLMVLGLWLEWLECLGRFGRFLWLGAGSWYMLMLCFLVV
jgi:hypothetical protein